MVLLQAAKQVVEMEGFDKILDDVRDRVDEIESLHRTRELTVRSHFSLSLSLLLAISDVTLTLRLFQNL